MTPPDEAREYVDRLLERFEADIDEVDADELLAHIRSDPGLARELVRRTDDLELSLNAAKVKKAEVMARLAAFSLLLSEPVEPEGHHPELAGGPAQEIALAAAHITRYAHDVVPFVDTDPDAALDEPTDPLFDVYLSVYANAVHGIRRAAYYLLNAEDSYAALASTPPEQETFPPLPFSTVWIEMAHLRPFMRFVDQEEKLKRPVLDVLGVLIAEVEQGSVWDVYVPFQFDNAAEFFFMAARIAPDRVVIYDEAFGKAVTALDLIRGLAVGAVHLITARNAAVETVVLPRHQRKRIAADNRQPPRLYFVNLSRSGEHATAATASGREYHVRWLVRGHWRHIPGGRRFCTCCDPPQIATWVEPYIKGPVGAPWKGRQVRRTLA